ncbi:hypothetical protein Cantr_08061 [Candida viswanathii]|uniref:Uncharacterized protein n=1 Tax=Candida viswanathii TaxID=5486 RepID=A0A367Y4X7_9ASCO|nr:hypothetical protein Cantr_08061 [Candida viswanathii]
MSRQSTQQESYETMDSIMEFLRSQQIECEVETLDSEALSNYQHFVKCNPDAEFDWQKLSDCFEHVFNLYASDVKEIRSKIDENAKQRTMLLEVYEKLDQERARKRIEKSMGWIKTEEEILGKIKSDISKWVHVIDTRFTKFVNRSNQ